MSKEIRTGLSSDHEEIINQYFSNGHNGTRAVMEIRPHIKTGAAAVIWNEIKRNPANKAYIQEKQNELRARTDISTEQLLRELISNAHADATDYINLSPEQLKELPPEARRAIQAIKINKRTVYDKKGNKNVIETVEVKLIDKLKAIDMIGKTLGMYEAHNNQKANRVNILQVLQKNDPKTLNNLLKALTDSADTNDQ